MAFTINVPTVSATSNTGTVSNGGTISDSLLTSTVSNILGLQDSATLDKFNASGTLATSSGYAQEQTAYQTTSAIETNNAAVSQAAGAVSGFQGYEKALSAIGTNEAVIAGGGFKEEGSARAAIRSSYQQANLENQLTKLQTLENVGGYFAAAGAAGAEASAAGAAASQASTTAGYYESAASLATANANNEIGALNSFLSGGKISPAEKLILSPLSSNVDLPTTLDTKSLVTSGGTTGGIDTATQSTKQSTTYGTSSGYPKNSTIMIGGVNYATDSEGRVVIQNKF